MLGWHVVADHLVHPRGELVGALGFSGRHAWHWLLFASGASVVTTRMPIEPQKLFVSYSLAMRVPSSSTVKPCRVG